MPRMRMVLIAALAASSGCARCGPPRHWGPPERHLPATTSLAVVIPTLQPAIQQLGGLYRTLAAVPAMAEVDGSWKSLRSQLGFDPLDVKGLESAGIDPAGGAAASLGPDTALLVLPVLDGSRLEAVLLRVSRDRMGAAQRSVRTIQSRQVITFSREANGPAALSYAVENGYALVAPGPAGPEAVASAAGGPSSSSLADEPSWRQARTAMGDAHPVLLFARRGSAMLPQLPLVQEGAALGLRAGPSSVGLRAAVLYGPDRTAWFAALAGALPEAARTAGRAEAARLSHQADLVMRWGGDPRDPGRRLLDRLPPQARSALDIAGIDWERDLLSNLQPGFAASVSLAPTFSFAELSSPNLDAARVDPFRLVTVEALVRVKDQARARALFARLTATAPRWGARLSSRTAANGSTTWTLSRGAGQLAWSLAGDRLAIAGSPDRLGPLEQRSAEAGYRPPTVRSRASLEDGIGGAVLDVGHLLGTVKALPDEAYGTGPNGFVMRSLAERFLEPVSRLRATSLRFDLAAGAAVIDLEIEGREETPERP